VLYVLRCLINADIPLNSGVLAPVKIIVPESLLNPPERVDPAQSPAVVGGNVETSQRVVDTLLGVLGVAAASQGTMNNLTFGDATFGYYETICGGSGATRDADGADAVHTHMTNTRLTDPEVLEWRFPVRLDSFRILEGTGGEGRHRGGNGGERRVRFLEPMTAVMLANHRRVAPFGVQGGSRGALGRNWVERADGLRETFGATFEVDMRAGDVFVVQTPGGGGFGPPHGHG
jgi:5-oxoprolinase (ATP-hydrolysing)